MLAKRILFKLPLEY